MKKLIQILFIFLIAIITSFITYRLSYLIAEEYFFDKVFYKKSLAHGYKACGGRCSLEDLEKLGKRSQEIISLRYSGVNNPTVLGATTEQAFTIAVIGDSYVWGQGVRDENTFSYLLEKKLNKIKKTRVLQFGYPGDSLLDNFDKYKLIEKLYNPDLFIFVFVENDLMFNAEQRYSNPLHYEITQKCQDKKQPITYHPKKEQTPDEYMSLLEETFSNPQNICILNEVARLSPKEGAVYFSPRPELDYMKMYMEAFESQGLKVVRLEEGLNLESYKKYWSNPRKYFVVSEKELHPSKIAHKMISDILFKEITSNNKLNFSF